jgi:hypothetical protein
MQGTLFERNGQLDQIKKSARDWAMKAQEAIARQV